MVSFDQTTDFSAPPAWRGRRRAASGFALWLAISAVAHVLAVLAFPTTQSAGARYRVAVLDVVLPPEKPVPAADTEAMQRDGGRTTPPESQPRTTGTVAPPRAEPLASDTVAAPAAPPPNRSREARARTNSPPTPTDRTVAPKDRVDVLNDRVDVTNERTATTDRVAAAPGPSNRRERNPRGHAALAVPRTTLAHAPQPASTSRTEPQPDAHEGIALDGAPAPAPSHGPPPPARRPAPDVAASAREFASAAPQPRVNVGYLRNPPPPYPAAARRKGEQGTVMLRVRVRRDGAPASVELEKSSGSSLLDEAAVAAVREWRFSPARQGGAAVEALVLVPVAFRLEDAS